MGRSGRCRRPPHPPPFQRSEGGAPSAPCSPNISPRPIRCASADHWAAVSAGSSRLSTLSKSPVITDLFAEKEGWQPGHIQLADEADLLLIAPASANVLASMAHGFANDALTAIALATRAPILIAPAMNGKMWQHPATVKNVETLRGYGARFVEPAEGMLACGYEGVGRLAEVETILQAAADVLSAKK